MKNLLFGLGLLCHLSVSEANQLFFPDFCSHREGQLVIENPTAVEESVWAQYDHPHFVEKRFILKAQSTLKISLQQFLEKDQAFAIKSFQPLLKIRLSCQGESTSGDTHSTTHFEHSITQAQKLILHLVNLSPGTNTLKLEFKNRWNQTIETHEILMKEYFESQKIKFQKPAGANSLRIISTGRMNSQLFDENLLQLQGRALKSLPLNPNQNLKYFLATTKHAPFESFVFSLSDPKLIQQAREQIQNPILEKIIVGYIQLGHQNTNRDFHSPGATPYSWAVEEVTSFADFAHIDCDGSPRLVEERIFERIQLKNSHICFWSYRVTRELSLQEVSSGVLFRKKP